MDQPPSSHWRQRFERGQRESRSESSSSTAPLSPQPDLLSGFDDGYDPLRRDAPTLSPEKIIDEAALALALDTHEYQPWVLQRGRSHPAMMLHLRRFEPRSGLWTGWQLSYPHLIAVEYTGDKMLSLDFGARQFIIMGNGLGGLVGHLQTGTVLTITEYNNRIWPVAPTDRGCVTSIAGVAQGAQP